MLVDYKRLICLMSATVRKSNGFTCLSLPDCKCITVFWIHNGAGKHRNLLNALLQRLCCTVLISKSKFQLIVDDDSNLYFFVLSAHITRNMFTWIFDAYCKQNWTVTNGNLKSDWLAQQLPWVWMLMCARKQNCI